MPRRRFDLTCGIIKGKLPKMSCICPPSRSFSAMRGALVRHVRHPGAGHLVEEFGGEVVAAASAAGAIVELAGIRLVVRNQFLDALDWNRRMERDHVAGLADQRDRRHVVHRVVGQLVERRIRGVCSLPPGSWCSRRGSPSLRFRCRSCRRRRAGCPRPPASRTPSLSFCAMMRATISEAPPGANGTINRIGLVGYFCWACTAPAASSSPRITVISE